MELSSHVKDEFQDVPERISGLIELAYNLWWSWNPRARMLFKTLNRQLWKESNHNPVRMLKSISAEILNEAARNGNYLKNYDLVMETFHEEIRSKKCWFTEHITSSKCAPICYISAEYGLHHSLPFYAGGLGFLAGDHIKECSDLGVPVVAIGFMYPEGYSLQKINDAGWQEDFSELLERGEAPITRVFDEKGEPLILRVPFIEPAIHVAVWRVLVGRVELYLLDTDVPQNDDVSRAISARLYAGDKEHRLLQEIVLGIGGAEVLFNIKGEDCVLHLNEGHTAFALLERVRRLVSNKESYKEAVKQVKLTSVFTTHTPIPAGHDVFSHDMMDKYFKSYYPHLGLDRESFLKLGMNPEKPGEGFNMTALALRLCEGRNGVSRRHGDIARIMWKPLWPDKDRDNVPISSITNGVHLPSWIEPKIELLFDKYLGADWQDRQDDKKTWSRVDNISDKELWQVSMWLKVKLLNTIRTRARKRWVENRVNPLNVITSGSLLDPLTFTIGFARRFATYKRAHLVFQDLDRLKNILNNPWRPVQLIFAGKAHPADDDGKRIIQKIFSYARDPGLVGRIAFLENYDEQLAQYMVHGVDLWLNNPIPPLEACGTSGMKATLNGVPHLSISDGWWVEGFNKRNGWSFDGTGDDFPDSEAIYRLLEDEIVPLYYDVDEEGVPHGWVKVMKEAIKQTGLNFSSRRMVKEYTTRFYQKALKESMKRSSSK